MEELNKEYYDYLDTLNNEQLLKELILSKEELDKLDYFHPDHEVTLDRYAHCFAKVFHKMGGLSLG